MSGMTHVVAKGTQQVEGGRVELLTFKMNSDQVFAINVFKIQEIIRIPKISKVPNQHEHVVGVAFYRNKSIPIINLSHAVGFAPLEISDNNVVIVTECNNSILGLVVHSVDRIVKKPISEVRKPPKGVAGSRLVTAVTDLNDKMLGILEVENILTQASLSNHNNAIELDSDAMEMAKGMDVLVIDGSLVDINKRSTLEALGLNVIEARNGVEALRILRSVPKLMQSLLMVITDDQMPDMDGYRFVREIRDDADLKGLYVMLWPSISCVPNEDQLQRVGFDSYLTKFDVNAVACKVEESTRAYFGLPMGESQAA